MAKWLASVTSNQRQSPLCVRLPQETDAVDHPNMTLAIEQEIKNQPSIASYLIIQQTDY